MIGRRQVDRLRPVHPPNPPPARSVVSLAARRGGRGFAPRIRRGGFYRHPHLGPIHDGHAKDLGCLVNLDHTAEPVVVGDPEGGVAEFGGAFDELQWMRSPVEEAVVGMGVKLRVPCHSNTLVERMFDLPRRDVGMAAVPFHLMAWDPYEEELTDEEVARLERRSRVRKLVVILVVVAMIATLVVPLIVRRVTTPREPDGIVAVHAPSVSRRMFV